MIRIPLTQGRFALVDEADAQLVIGVPWYAERLGNTFYATARVKIGGRKRTVKMHRVLLGATSGDVDHINGDGLDNRRANIRLATRSQNNANARKQRGASSSYKGVTWDKNRCCWRVAIGPRGKRQYLGAFQNEALAGIAYNQAARRLFGAFARVNEVRP